MSFDDCPSTPSASSSPFLISEIIFGRSGLGSCSTFSELFQKRFLICSSWSTAGLILPAASPSTQVKDAHTKCVESSLIAIHFRL